MLTPEERQYLATQTLGRIATVRPDGSLQNNPVGFRYDEATGTFDIGGRNMGASRKFRNVAANGQVAFVVDDIASRNPWVVRGIEVRGRADAVRELEPQNASAVREVIRIHPSRIVSWGLDPTSPGMAGRDVATHSDDR